MKIISALDFKRSAFIALALPLLFFCTSPALALLCGILFAAIVSNPFVALTKKLVSPCLGVAIVCMGAGMNLEFIGSVGMRGFSSTFFTITITMFFSWWLGRALQVDKDVTLLLGVGTAICGGSAIAAVSGPIKAKLEHVSVATAIVFLLNAVALFVFPVVGRMLGLSEQQFGLWAALAVHDTSSVVATAENFGPEALVIGTTVKLARALWIAPLTLTIAYFFSEKGSRKTFYLPWFIIGFVVFAAVGTYVPGLERGAIILGLLSKRILVLALFFVGVNISLPSLKTLSARSLIHGLVLWIIVSVLSLIAILYDLIAY